MQNYDANREWALIGTRGTGTPASSADYYYERIERTVVPAIRRLLAGFRARGSLVVHTLFASPHPGAPDMPPLWRLRFDQHAEDSGRRYSPVVGRPEMDILEALATLAEDAAAAPDPGFHAAAVRVLGAMYCQVRATGWILEKLGRPPL